MTRKLHRVRLFVVLAIALPGCFRSPLQGEGAAPDAGEKTLSLVGSQMLVSKLDLLFGTERAQVYFFRNTGTNEKPQLETGKPIGLTGGDFGKGIRNRINVTDWNEDGKIDLLVGNFYVHRRPMGGNVWLFLGK